MRLKPLLHQSPTQIQYSYIQIQLLPPTALPVNLADLSAVRNGEHTLECSTTSVAKPQISLLPMTMKTLRLANINTRTYQNQKVLQQNKG